MIAPHLYLDAWARDLGSDLAESDYCAGREYRVRPWTLESAFDVEFRREHWYRPLSENALRVLLVHYEAGYREAWSECSEDDEASYERAAVLGQVA